MPKGGKFDRCVEHVKKQGNVDNPYAICTASTGLNNKGKPIKALTNIKTDSPKQAAPVRPQKTTVMKPNSTNKFTPPKHKKRPDKPGEVKYDKSLADGVKAADEIVGGYKKPGARKPFPGAPGKRVQAVLRSNDQRNSQPGGGNSVKQPTQYGSFYNTGRGKVPNPQKQKSIKNIESTPVSQPYKPPVAPKPNAVDQHYQALDNKYKLDTKPANSPVSMLGMGDRNVKNNKSIVDKTIIKNLFQQSSKLLIFCDKMISETGNKNIKSLLVNRIKELVKELDNLEKMSKSL